jgi:hypothetical protein
VTRRVPYELPRSALKMNIHINLVLVDVCFWTYILIALVSGYGFGLFYWWKRLAGHASEVYNYMMIMFVAIFCTYALNAYARYLFLIDVDNLNLYETFITNWIWQVRAVPNLIIISLIVGRMNQRARRAIKLLHQPSEERRFIKRRQVDK